jgi:hypothetical protein
MSPINSTATGTPHRRPHKRPFCPTSIALPMSRKKITTLRTQRRARPKGAQIPSAFLHVRQDAHQRTAPPELGRLLHAHVLRLPSSESKLCD